MTYNEALVIVEELKGVGKAPFSIHQKQQIAEIFPLIMGRKFRKTSCPRCYHDAVIEMAVRLRKEKTMPKKCNYRMRAGFIIHNPAIDNGKIYTNANLTDDVARRFLELYPQKANMFEVIPAAEEKPAETPAEAPETEVKASVQPSEKKAKKSRSKRKKGK